MTKYLDSKGLSYLWQKIKAELALKEGVHSHPYLGWVSDIKAEDAGKVVVFGTPEYEKYGKLTSLPTAVGNTLGRDVASTSVFADEAYVRLGEQTKLQLKTITETPEGGQTTSYKVWDIPFATSDKFGVVRTGDAAFTAPSDSDTTSPWHKAPIVDGYVWYKNSEADANTVTAAADLIADQIVLGADSKGIKVAGNTISTAFGETSASETAVPTEKAITDYITASTLKIEQRSVGEGEVAKLVKYIVLRDKYNNEITSIDATDFLVDGMLDSVTHEGNKLVLTWNTDAGKQPIEIDLSNYIDAYTPGSGISITDNEIKVNTTEDGVLENHNVETGFDVNGNVVGYVDLSAYQKSSDLVAFTQSELDAIFDSAEYLYASRLNGTTLKDKDTPAYPELDPLAKETPSIPAVPPAVPSIPAE